MLIPWKKSYDKPREHIKKQRQHFAEKGPYSQSYGFSSSQRLSAQDLMFSNWVVGEDSWESLGLQGDPTSLGRTNAEAEAPILWPPDVKSQLNGKNPDAGKDWGQEKTTSKDKVVGWHHWFNEHEFEQAPGDGEGQGSLVCCSPWGCKE